MDIFLAVILKSSTSGLVIYIKNSSHVLQLE